MDQNQEKPPKKSDGGTSSFLRAARSGNLDKVIEHLKNKIDINTSNSNGLNALHLASKDGHLEIVRELLKRGANVNSATKKGNTALHIASLAGQYDVVVTLVENGAIVNVQSQNGFTPLYMGAQENHDRVVKYLLANGANQNLATEDGFTPCAVAMQQGHEKVVTVLLENDTKGKVRLPALHIAAKKDDCKAADLLLQNDHNPDVTSKSGFTPLHIASHYGNDGIAKLLLTKGADVNYSAKHNITPLHVAAKWGKSNMVSLLLESGANIEAKTRDGLTALHCAARSGHEQVIDMLLQRNAPISSKTKNGLTSLHMAAQGDHVEAAKVLLNNNAPVDDVTVDYLTGLHVAAHCGHIRVAKLLLEKHADPDARALNGFTPLHIACKKNRIKVVELLLKYNASLEATTESGLTPLHVASFMGCMNIVIFLLQHEANSDLPTVRGETPLHLAARANQTDIIRILLRNGAQVDARAREKQTPLHIASRLGNVDIVMLLLAHGAAVDSTTKDLYTALHIASKEGQEEVASVLLDNEASVIATTKKGFTPLHLSSKYGNIKVTKLLLQKEAPVDAQGKNGVTPLHVASHYDHQAVALMLLDKQASPHAAAKNGHTPLHIAAKKNQMDIANTLLDYGAKTNTESKAGFTPLHLSTLEGNVEMSTLLLNHNADPNSKSKNGLTPLHLCAQEDKHKIAVVLDNYHADINSETKTGFTPLHVACHFGQLNMVRFLTSRQGINLNAVTSSGYTPLHQAAQQGHSTIVSHLLEKGADPNLLTNQGQTPLSISQKLGYISVVEALKNVTKAKPTSTSDEKYKVNAPETMQETFMSDSEDEGGEETLINEQSYRYLTGEEMKGFGDESAPIDVTRDERCDANTAAPPSSIDDIISPQTVYDQYSGPVDNIDIVKYPPHIGRLQWKTFLVSFLVDARGGAMRGCRHSGVRVIVPPRRASMPTRVTCRYLRREKLVHPPPLMEGESLASRILELGPVGAKFLGPVMIEVPNFGSMRGSEREIVVLRSDNGETWKEHTVEVTDEIVKDILGYNFDKEDRDPWHSGNRLTRIVTTEFPHYFAIVSRVKQEVHAIGPEGGVVSSTVVPQVQAAFPQGALTKRIKVGLQAQPIPSELTTKLLGNRVAVSPIVTVEPRRRKFHKPITLTIPLPQAASKGMINHYTGDAPTLRLLCSITGGTSRAQWEDVTGSTPLTFINDCVSFTTTVSARFWLMDCRNVADASKMATELYKEVIHVPFIAKFAVFAKRTDLNEARIRLFCMTDDREDKFLENKEQFTEVSNSRDVEVLEGKPVYIEFAGNLVPVTKSGEQLKLVVRAFKENRLPFTMRVKDPTAEPRSWTIIMKEPKVSKNEISQTPVCVLQFALPENIVPDNEVSDSEKYNYTHSYHSTLEPNKRIELRLTDLSNFVSDDWTNLAHELGFQSNEIAQIKKEYPESSSQQCMSMLNLWMNEISAKDSVPALEKALNNIGRVDVIEKCNMVGIENQSKKPIYANPEKLKKDKYAAEEKVVIEDEINKTVNERRMEIEQRLNGEPVVIEKKLDPRTKIETFTTKAIEKPIEPIEPTEVSFEHKRMSFERGVSIESVLLEDIPLKDKPQQLGEDKKMKSIEEKLSDSDVDGTSLSFHEKRLSFEQGIPVREIIQKKTEETVQEQITENVKDSEPLSEIEKSFTKSETTSSIYDETTVPDLKPEIVLNANINQEKSLQAERDLMISVKVAQNLENLDTNSPKVENKDDLLLSKSFKTLLPSQADFNNAQKNEFEKSTSPLNNIETEGSEVNLSQYQNEKSLSCSEPSTEITTNAISILYQNSIDKIPPKPNPRYSIDISTALSLDEDNTNYSTKKQFWEEKSKSAYQPPLPKPRHSISLPVNPNERSIMKNSSLDLNCTSFDTSDHAEISEMIKKPLISNQTTNNFVVNDSTCQQIKVIDDMPKTITLENHSYKARPINRLDSEAEYIQKYGEESLAYENQGFQEDDLNDVNSTKHIQSLEESTLKNPINKEITSNQYIEQIKPQILSMQMEQEFSPEHKSLKNITNKNSLSQEVLINRQIHKHIFSNELDEQIDSLIPEVKHFKVNSETDFSTNLLINNYVEKSSSISEKSITKTESNESSTIDDLPEEKINKNANIISKYSSSLSQDLIEEIPSDTYSKIEQSEKNKLQTEYISSSLHKDLQHEYVINPIEETKTVHIIHTPEEHIQDTIWEVTQIRSDSQDIIENVNTRKQEEFQNKSVKQDNILELTEISKNDMTNNLAKDIAEQLVNEIEIELTKRQDVLANLQHLVVSPEHLKQLENSGYLDIDGDDLKIKLIESVLAKKSREQLKNISKNDTVTSSIEITDEDLKSSGFEIEYDGFTKLPIINDIIIDHKNNKSDEKTIPENLNCQSEIFNHNDNEKNSNALNNEVLIHCHLKNVNNEETLTEISQNCEVFSTGQITHDSSSQKNHRDISIDVSERITLNTDIKQIDNHEKGSYIKLHDNELFHDIIKYSETKLCENSIILQQRASELENNRIDTSECFDIESEVQETDGKNSIKTKQKYVDTKLRDFDKIVKKESEEHEEITDDGSTIISNTNKESHIMSNILIETCSKSKNEISLKDEQICSPISNSPLVKHLSTESLPSKDNSIHSPTSPSSSSIDIREEKHVNFDSVTLRKPDSVNIMKLTAKRPADSSSSESHYQSFDLTSSSRPCSSDVDGLLACSSEYESAISVPSNEYHTAISSLSSRESMKSLDSESSGNLASVENSEASETLIASTGDLDYDIEVPNDILEEDIKIESYEQKIPMQIIRGESLPLIAETSDKKYSSIYKTQPFSQPTINSENNAQKMKRSHEMTFHPVPKHITSDSLSDSSSHEEKQYSSESMSISSTEGPAIQTVVETTNGYPKSVISSFSLSDDSATLAEKSTTTNKDNKYLKEEELNQDVTILSSFLVENETLHNVSTQITSKFEEVQKKGHRRSISSVNEIVFEGINLNSSKEIDLKDSSNEIITSKQCDQSLYNILTKTTSIETKKCENILDLGKNVDVTSICKHSDSGKLTSPISEKHSFEHIDDVAEADAAFQMVPHVSPVIPTSLPPTIPEDPFSEDEDDLIEDTSNNVPNIMVTEHMAPLIDHGFCYPDLDLEAKELENKSTPETPASISSKESSDTDQGKEYVLNNNFNPHEESSCTLKEHIAFEKVEELVEKDSISLGESFEIIENNEEIPNSEEEFIIVDEIEKDIKCQLINIEGTEDKNLHSSIISDNTIIQESDIDKEYSNLNWVELQFDDDNTVNEIFDYNMEYDRPPLEDIKEEDTEDLHSSKVGSVGSQVSQSIGSFGSMKESFSSTPESKKYLGKSLEHDNLSINSLQEFERLEQLVRIESMQAKSSGSLASNTSSSSNSRKEDNSLGSLKDFEAIEAACIQTEMIENKALESEKLLINYESVFKIYDIGQISDFHVEQNEEISEKLHSDDDNLTSTDSLDLKTIVTDIKPSISAERIFVESISAEFDDCMNSSISSRDFSSSLIDDHSKESSNRDSLILGSNDSLGPSSSTATNATYHCETGSNLSSSFTSGGSNTMVSSMEGLDKAGIKNEWFEGSEFIETQEKDHDDTKYVQRIIKIPAEIHKVSAKGLEKVGTLDDFVEKFNPEVYEDKIEHTDEFDNTITMKKMQKRMIFETKEEFNKGISKEELNECLRKLSDNISDQYEYSNATANNFQGSTKENQVVSNISTLNESDDVTKPGPSESAVKTKSKETVSEL